MLQEWGHVIFSLVCSGCRQPRPAFISFVSLDLHQPPIKAPAGGKALQDSRINAICRIAVQQPDLAKTKREFGMVKCQPIRMLQASSCPLGSSPDHSNKYTSQIQVVIPKDNRDEQVLPIPEQTADARRTQEPIVWTSHRDRYESHLRQVQAQNRTCRTLRRGRHPTSAHVQRNAAGSNKRKERRKKKGKKSKGKFSLKPPKKIPRSREFQDLHNDAVLVVRFEIPRCSFGRMQKTKARLADGNLQICVVNSLKRMRSAMSCFVRYHCISSRLWYSRVFLLRDGS